ncbi:hypothetical protein [Candidatus Poriferisodalis sp.]|uniref:hypothetical protein n=1 Tax=Candidatus Poriferisodalis sp. TaxID=3101277 RepID=UPI003C6F3873
MAADPAELSDEDLERLRVHCDEFYKERSISTYFNTRLAVLAAVNEHREQFVEWANEGVSFHGLDIQIPSVETDDAASDPPSANSDPLQWYIQTETISLQHHALETLLRLYTGLVDAADWLHPLMAVTDRDRNLPELVEQHITRKTKRAMRSDVSYLLLGQSEVPDDEDRLAVLDNLVGILKVLARKWLDGRRPYNAIKHGLLISQSNASLSLGPTPDDMVTIADGPSIAFLNHTNWERQPTDEDSEGAKTRQWTIETKWIRFEQASKLIAVACVLIDCLWSLAVARWSQEGTDKVRLAILDPDKINPRMLLTAGNGPPGHNMSRNLFTDTKTD